MQPDPSPGGDGPDGTVRPPVLSRPLAWLFVASFGATSAFYLLLSVVPLYATTGGAGDAGAGATTGALLFATVAAELVTPRLAARFGYRVVFGAGLLLLGAPALALPLSAQLPPVVVLSALRGLGFGIVVVLGSALIATLVPPQRRGEGLGLYGVVVGVPGILALPLGIFLVGQIGYPPVLVAGGAVALAGLLVVAGLPGRPADHGQPADPSQPAKPGQPAGCSWHSEPARPAEHGQPSEPARPGQPDPRGSHRREEPTPAVGILAGLRDPALLWPSVVFAGIATAAGAIVTFLPLAVSAGSGPASGNLAALALLVQAAVTTVVRWWAGRYGDRRGPERLLVPAVLAAGGGVLLLVLLPSPVAVLAGVVLFGAGFGASQNASLSLMFNRVPRSGYGAVSAVWNIAFDAGIGLGAAGFGLVAAQTGYPLTFAVTAVLILVMLLPAWRDRRPISG